MKKIFPLIVIFLFSLQVKAQSDFMQYSMRSLNQSTSLNPAFMPEYDLSIGVPIFSGIHTGILLNGLNSNKVLSTVTSDSLIDMVALASKLDRKFFGVRTTMQTEIFHVRYQFQHYQFSVFSNLKVNSNVMLSSTFLDFIANGNGAYLGKNMSFAGNNIQFTSYIETGIGAAREFETFTVGARMKFISGIANVSTGNMTFNMQSGSLSTDPLHLSFGGNLNTSGMPCLADSINGSPVNDNLSNRSILDDLRNTSLFTNPGLAFDFGATWHISPQLSLNASLIDIGFINWNGNVYNYNLNQYSMTFPGVRYVQVSSDSMRRSTLDSMKQIFLNQVKAGSITNNPYSSSLVTRFIVGADYDLSLRDKFSLTIQFQYFNESFFPSYIMSYSRKVGTNWNICSSYGYFNDNLMNLGLGTSIKIGAFQVYAMTDDILVYRYPQYGRNVYLRFGFNLVWGGRHDRPRY